MTPSRLRILFEEAVDLPAPARRSFLDARCGDSALRARLERMLAVEAGPKGALPQADAATLAASLQEQDFSQMLQPGAVIGSFELNDVLGEGGSSTVFRAARTCDGVRQFVALKLLRRAIYTRDARQQFRRERLALTKLGHPGIARLIEGGVTDTGVAYIALELVEGLPITAYVREHHLDLRQRLRLFLDICRAVDAAHHALIVHRDLKPSNVLVTTNGIVKLLDFGIAKLLDGDGDGDATQTRLPAFTPAYASPEQRNGGFITTATDVYALGVLLGELMTGERLSEASRCAPSSRVRDGLEPGVLPASASATRKQLRGDPDNIVLKAIDADPSRRYASAGALADDIRRLLDGRPVKAHPPSNWYRTRKFAARHRGGVAAAALAVFAMLGALVLISWQARVARGEARRANEVQNFLESLFEPFQDGISPARAPSVNELLKRGMTRITHDFATDPRARADTMAMFARINDAVGEVRGNLELARDAWSADAHAYGDDDMRTLQSRALYARVLRRNGRYKEALAQYEAVSAAMRESSVRGLEYAYVLESTAVTLEQLGRMPQALELKRRSVAEREADPAAGPDDLADGYNGLGVAYDSANDHDKALQNFEKSYALRIAGRGEGTASATALANIGNANSWMGRWREAAEKLQSARAMYARVGTTTHPNLMSLLIRLCDVQAERETSDARSICDAAVTMAEQIHGTAHPQYAMALTRRVRALLAAGEMETAVADVRRARAIFIASEGDTERWLDHVAVAESALSYAREDWQALRDGLRNSATSKAGAQAPTAPRTYAWFALACLHAPGDGCSGAVVRAERVLADPLFAHHPYQLTARVALAQIDLAPGNARAAIARVDEGLAIAVQELGETHSAVAEAHLLLARAHAVIGEQAAALTEWARADAIVKALPAAHPLRQRIIARMEAQIHDRT